MGMGASGAPGMPQPGSQRARDLAVAYADDERGRFTERIYRWPDFGTINGLGSAPTPPQSIQIVSNRTSFVRLVALRGGLKTVSGAHVAANLDPANISLRLQINGEEDLTTNGQGSLPAEFDGLFSPVAPWFWFAAPPRLRVSDQLQATISSTFPGGDGNVPVTVYLLARIVDDEWWRELYGT
jgi:hypothetical protein